MKIMNKVILVIKATTYIFHWIGLLISLGFLGTFLLLRAFLFLWAVLLLRTLLLLWTILRHDQAAPVSFLVYTDRQTSDNW